MSPGKFPDEDTVALAKDTPVDNEHLNGNVPEDSKCIGVLQVPFFVFQKFKFMLGLTCFLVNFLTIMPLTRTTTNHCPMMLPCYKHCDRKSTELLKYLILIISVYKGNNHLYVYA